MSRGRDELSQARIRPCRACGRSCVVSKGNGEPSRVHSREWQHLGLSSLPWWPHPYLSAPSSVSTIRNQRYHIHANLSCAILVAQVVLLISFHFEPGTVSGPLGPAGPTAGLPPIPSSPERRQGWYLLLLASVQNSDHRTARLCFLRERQGR